MGILNLYEEISDRGIRKIRKRKEFIDERINNEYNAMNLVLLIRPTEEIKLKIKEVENKLKNIENNQYYYPKKDYHITLLEFISPKLNFKYTQEQVEIYDRIVKKVLGNTNKFKIKFNGIIASEGAIIVKGYYPKEMEELRVNLRNEILNSGLELDERYPTKSCHITISRFKQKIQEREEFIKFVQDYGNYDFGEFEVSNIELVYHNWSDSKREIIKRYEIK